MKKTLLTIVYVIILSFTYMCSGSEKLQYDFPNFIKHEAIKSGALRDSVDQYIMSISLKKHDAYRNYFPEINKMDVSSNMSTVEGDTYLSGLGEFIIPFANSSYWLLAAGFFLRDRYSLTRIAYDNLLRSCIQLDSTNHEAMFLLSQLRYEAGYVMEAKYVMEVLHQRDPNNEEVNRLLEGMRKAQAASFPSFEEFLKIEAFYRED